MPNTLQSCVINEDEEEEEREDENIQNINKGLCSGPTFTVTKDQNEDNKSRPGSGDYGEMMPLEDTDTPDGLRNYLQRMISAGMLPGGSEGPPDLLEAYSDDER